MHILAVAQVATSGSPVIPLAVAKADPQIAAAIHGISPAKVQEDMAAKLVSFGTRSTLSSMDTLDLPSGAWD